MNEMSYADAERIINSSIGSVARLKADYKLQRMQDAMAVLGNPQNDIRVVHVAGTSGKTSTSYFIASLLQASGKKVGLTVSPHITSLRDRVQINLTPISEDTFARYFREFWQILAPSRIDLTYFEILVAFAYWVFAQEKVDYAVVEVGLGGLLDGTNTITRADKLCVITDIGFDHTAVLGNTLPEIAAQKAGIIQQGNTVITYEQSPEIMNEIAQRAAAKQAQVNILPTEIPAEFQILTQDLPLYQQHNWWLGYKAWETVKDRDNLQDLGSRDLQETLITIPGRLEVYTFSGKTIILDGAHNPQKMEALVSSLEHMFPDKKFAIGLSMKEDKDYQAALELLLPLAREVVATKLDPSQDLMFKNIEAKDIEVLCEAHDVKFHYEEDHRTFLQDLYKQPHEYILVTGSLYLVSSIRSLLQKQR